MEWWLRKLATECDAAGCAGHKGSAEREILLSVNYISWIRERGLKPAVVLGTYKGHKVACTTQGKKIGELRFIPVRD